MGVDRLTQESYELVALDNGTKVRAVVPPLWAQAMEALHGLYRKGNEGGPGSLSERGLVDLDLMEACALIRETTRAELAKRHIHPRAIGIHLDRPVPFKAAEFRTLAAAVLPEVDDLWWWEYRFASWARWLANYLRIEHSPRKVRLRNAPCPECRTTYVVVEGDDGPVVAGPILIDFSNGYVRAAQCTGCGHLWWRGEDLERLAKLLTSTD